MFTMFADTNCCWRPWRGQGQQEGPVMVFPEARAPERVGIARDRHPERKVWKPP